MGKPTFNVSFNVCSLLLILGLISCGQSPSVTAPDDAAGAAAETPEAASTPTEDKENKESKAPKSPTESPTESPSTNPGSASTGPGDTTQPPRSSPVALAKQDCGQLATQQEMNQCAAENYAVSDKALGQVYQEIQQDLDDGAKARLTTADERWIVFRDAQCTFASDRFEGGSIAPLIQATCMEQITDNRIAELRQTVQTDTSLAAADAQLNEVYQAVQALASETAGETLIDVQLAWLDYRDTHCEYEANLVSAPNINACLAAITETRVWQLETLQDEWSL